MLLVRVCLFSSNYGRIYIARPYVMKKYKEPSEKQNLKKYYNILYAFTGTLYLDAALL